MKKEDFCDKFCPVAARWVEFPCVDNELTVDCDLEESDCPFNNVDFSKVKEHEYAGGREEKVADDIKRELTGKLDTLIKEADEKDGLVLRLKEWNEAIKESIN